MLWKTKDFSVDESTNEIIIDVNVSGVDADAVCIEVENRKQEGIPLDLYIFDSPLLFTCQYSAFNPKTIPSMVPEYI